MNFGDEAVAQAFFALLHVTFFREVLHVFPDLPAPAAVVALAGVALMARDYARLRWR